MTGLCAKPIIVRATMIIIRMNMFSLCGMKPVPSNVSRQKRPARNADAFVRQEWRAFFDVEQIQRSSIPPDMLRPRAKGYRETCLRSIASFADRLPHWTCAPFSAITSWNLGESPCA